MHGGDRGYKTDSHRFLPVGMGTMLQWRGKTNCHKNLSCHEVWDKGGEAPRIIKLANTRVWRWVDRIQYWPLTALAAGWDVPAVYYVIVIGKSAAEGVGFRPFTCWERRFKSCRGNGCLLSGTGLCLVLIHRPEEFHQMRCVWVWSWSLDNEDALAH